MGNDHLIAFWIFGVPILGLVTILTLFTYMNQGWLGPLVGIVFIFVLVILENMRRGAGPTLQLPGLIWLIMIGVLVVMGHLLFNLNFAYWAEAVLVIMGIMIGYIGSILWMD